MKNFIGWMIFVALFQLGDLGIWGFPPLLLGSISGCPYSHSTYYLLLLHPALRHHHSRLIPLRLDPPCCYRSLLLTGLLVVVFPEGEFKQRHVGSVRPLLLSTSMYRSPRLYSSTMILHIIVVVTSPSLICDPYDRGPQSIHNHNRNVLTDR